MVKEISVRELAKMQEDGTDFQLIDVREPNEYDIANLNGELIPMNQIPQSIEKIAKDKTVVVHCRSGARSAQVIHYLQTNHDFNNLYNLKGGILAYADEIDSSLTKY